MDYRLAILVRFRIAGPLVIRENHADSAYPGCNAMILSELRSYLKQQKRVALKEMETHFNIDGDAIRGMLGKWINKGYVRKLPGSTPCSSGCCKCDPSLTELYEWIDR